MGNNYSSETFLNEIKNEYNLNIEEYTIYSDQWPLLKLRLNEQQSRIISNIKSNIYTIIKSCEIKANIIHPVNAGIIDTTKINFNGNELSIKGSETVIRLLLKEIF